MGPPSAKLVSQWRMILVGAGMPNDFSVSSTLLLCDHAPAMLPKYVPLNVLPPCLGDEVELRTAAVGLAEAARHRELHFRGARGVVAVARHAAAVEGRADVHAVDLHGAFVAAAAARREEDHVGVGAAVLNAVGLNARHGRQEVPVAARRRQRRQDLVAQHALHARAVLHVDDGRLAGHGNRFRHGADAQLGVERHGHAGLEFDAASLERREAGQ